MHLGFRRGCRRETMDGAATAEVRLFSDRQKDA